MTGIRMYCSKCASLREGPVCFKCGSDLIKASDFWVEPELPSVATIRSLAMQVGYAIAVHGSQQRDLDLIAVPWTDTAVDTDVFIQHLCTGLDASVVDKENKPFGRLAFTLQIDGYFKPIDLSVTAKVR